MLERRSEIRFRLGLAADMGESVAGGSVRLSTRDVSSAGAFLLRRSGAAAEAPWSEGDMVRVGIFLPAIGQEPGRHASVIRAEGRVVRNEDEGLAVRFGRQCCIEPIAE